MENADVQIGMILENVEPKTGRPLAVVRVMGEVNVGGATWFRVCDERETATDEQIIQRNRSWAVPAENLRGHDADCTYCHKRGLVAFA